MDPAAVANDVKRSDLLQMYYYLRLTRALEDRITNLYRQGRIVGGVYTSHGMEAIAVGYASALEPDDVVAPFHRDMGAFSFADSPRRNHRAIPRETDRADKGKRRQCTYGRSQSRT